MKVFIDKAVHEEIVSAYRIYVLEDGERIVRVHDAVHSLLYH